MTGSQAVMLRRTRKAEPCGDGNFTYVAIDDHGHPQVIKRDEPPISIQSVSGEVDTMSIKIDAADQKTSSPAEQMSAPKRSRRGQTTASNVWH